MTLVLSDLKPCFVYWTVQVKHGRGWRTYPMHVKARSDLSAVCQVRRSWGKYKCCRVRCAEFPDKWRRLRFA